MSRKASYEPFAKVWWLLRIEAREKRGVHREDLAEALGYPSDQAGFIADYDNAERLPEPANLDKLCTCMGISYANKALLFDLAGYRFSRPVPNLDSIKQELSSLAGMSSKSRYPAIITDRRFAVWMLNPAAIDLFSSSEESNPIEVVNNLVRFYHAQVNPRFVTVFDVFFNSSLNLKSGLMDVNNFFKYLVARFKSLNRGEQHRRFYMEYPECMTKWLSPEDYSIFKMFWEETDAGFKGKEELYLQGIETGSKIHMDLTTTSIPSLNGYFEITYLTPSTEDDDPQNILTAHKIFHKRPDGEKGYLALWDIVPANDLLNQYEQEYIESWRASEIIDKLEGRLKESGINVEEERKKMGPKFLTLWSNRT